MSGCCLRAKGDMIYCSTMGSSGRKVRWRTKTWLTMPRVWEPGLEVEATIVLHGTDYRTARPDNATWRDLPLPSDTIVEAHKP